MKKKLKLMYKEINGNGKTSIPKLVRKQNKYLMHDIQMFKTVKNKGTTKIKH